VDFIFGAMKLVVDHATIIANVTEEKHDNCYISAGRSGSADSIARGMLFWHCHIQSPVPQRVWLARPWRYWGETVWAYTTWDENVLVPEAWHTGLTKGQACPNSYEYKSQDGSVGRPEWVQVLTKPVLPDGTPIDPKKW
jgi:pectin methylesterase-like acyl-CoA thioesterase